MKSNGFIVMNMSDRFSDEIQSLREVDSANLSTPLEQINAEMGRADEITSIIDKMRSQDANTILKKSIADQDLSGLQRQQIIAKN